MGLTCASILLLRSLSTSSAMESDIKQRGKAARARPCSCSGQAAGTFTAADLPCARQQEGGHQAGGMCSECSVRRLTMKCAPRHTT